MAGSNNSDLEQPLLLANEEDPETLQEAIPVIAEPVAQEVIRAEISVTPSNGPDRERRDAPRRWRDGVCNCCVHGCCHPSFLYPLYCPFLAIGQVMARLNLNILGRRGTKLQATLTFFFLFTLFFLIFYFGSKALDFDVENHINNPNSAQLQWILPSSIITFFLFYLIVVTRRNIRRRDEIPDGCCGIFDDCCGALFFPCCTISQMMRHTADYSVYRAVWISQTGLPAGVNDYDDENAHSRV